MNAAKSTQVRKPHWLAALALFPIATLAQAAPVPVGTLSPEPFHTAAARSSVATTLPAGATLRVLGATSLPSGESFAQVEWKGKAYWIPLAAGAQLPANDDEISLEHATYLLLQPVAETEEAADPSESPFDDAITEAAQAKDAPRSAYPLVPSRIGSAEACTNFISPKSAFGPWGSFMMSTLSPQEHPNLFRADVDDMPTICPRFGKMSVTEKKNFWVWLVASMANEESSCRERVTARGVNGTAAGLLQLHLGHESVYGCRAGTKSLQARDNLQCGLKILNNDINRTDRVFPGRNNYWQVLRLQTESGKRTYRLALKYAPCREAPKKGQ